MAPSLSCVKLGEESINKVAENLNAGSVVHEYEIVPFEPVEK